MIRSLCRYKRPLPCGSVKNSWRTLAYEKKTPVEHVLLRPGMYIGQTESVATDTWLYDQNIGRMTKCVVSYNPALLKIFDEILVNAADNKQRDPTMSKIVINIARLPNNSMEISVLNDGKSIPIELHKNENIYIPELVFGHLLTGSNFNDKENRLTGGSHGYGAKLTNIFSKSFILETQNGKENILYKQKWSKNMSKVSTPTISASKNNQTYTKITFEPDLQRFGGMIPKSASVVNGDKMSTSVDMIDQAVQLFQRRALDIAACIAPTKVEFSYTNSTNQGAVVGDAKNVCIPQVQSFQEYVQLFRPVEEVTPESVGLEAATEDTSALLSAASTSAHAEIVHCRVNPRWEVAIGQSSTGNFETMSFVNSVWTVRGGTHVNLVATQVVKAVEAALAKRNIVPTSAAIRNKLMVFVNSKIENPSFDGQTKDALNTKPAAFGSTCKLSDSFLKDIINKTGILESIIEDVALKEESRLLGRTKSTKRKVLDVPKLEDAHAAGGEKALDCTLILTEGDSAKALAVSGLEVVGRELYGVMPLRGKVLNVRGATRAQVFKNEEFINLCKALGLDFTKTYQEGLENAGLRYGRVMIMCDQDTDGSHIKGLVINLFHHFWPALLGHEGFLQQFITPIVKARPRSRGQKEVMSFYSIPEFKRWQENREGLPTAAPTSSSSSTDGEGGVGEENSRSNDDKYSIKYYKGLGTNTAAEGREYFRALEQHRKQFQAIRESDADLIDLAFSKDRAGHRKVWLAETHDPQTFLDPQLENISYSDFINKELIHFSIADIQRSIPSVVDGLKPSQRKVLFGCFKKKLIKEEAKVVQIAGYIAEHTAYHHGEASLHATIINMAQDYVGSNNVPYLVASGQFGTRAQGGKDHASPRYVFTRLSPLTRLLFPEEDDALLEYEQEDGQSVEPKYFVPVVPTLLLNGSQGIGTGWSTSIPPHHLPHVIQHVQSRLRGTSPAEPLAPYVVGFRGTIAPVMSTATQFRSTGVIRVVSANKLSITELPYGTWTDDYKRLLLTMVESGEIKGFQELHGTNSVCFEVTASRVQIESFRQKGLESVFRLNSSISLNNMHAFDQSGKIRKYHSAEEILDAHFNVRHEAYRTRKDALERKHSADELRSRNKSRFIRSILGGEIEVLQQAKRGRGASVMTESHIISELQRQGYADEGAIEGVLHGTSANSASSSSSGASGSARAGYGYLLDLPILSLTDERSQQLHARSEEASARLADIRGRTAEDLWMADLNSLASAHDKLMTTSESHK